MKTYKYLQLNADLGGKKKGEVIRIECVKVSPAKKGEPSRYIPKDQYWRNRLKDAVIDKCVEFVDKPKPAKPDVKPEDTKAAKPKT